MDKDRIEEIAAELEKHSLETAYGRAVLAAHRLEKTLFLLLLTKVPAKVPEGDQQSFDRKCQKLRKLPLGSLIKGVLNEFDIEPYWEGELDNMLFFRNRLVHQIAEDVMSSVWTHGDHSRIVDELETIRSYFIETDREMRRLLFEWLEPRGITEEKVEEVSREMITQAKAKTKGA